MIARSFDVIRRVTTIGALSLLLGAALALDPIAGRQPVPAHGMDDSGWVLRWRDLRDGSDSPDGYLWLGSEFGLFRFDGIHAIPWQPAAGQRLPGAPYSLLVTRDGTLWIGTFAGLASWSRGTLTRYPEVGEYFVTSLLEDRQGTVWAGLLGKTGGLCSIRGGHAQCHLEDGALGYFVWTLREDASGVLWAGC